MRLCTEECRVLGHSDQCWMPPLASPASSSSDYRSNLYIPGEEARPLPDLSQDKTPQPCTDTGPARNQSFSTFGKDLGGEDGDEEEGGDNDGGEVRDEDLCATTSLLSEMNSVFQRLLPQGIDSYVQVNENQKGVSLSGVGVPMTGSLDRRRGHLPGKPNPSVHQQGVAAWAANTHFQNPGSSIGPGHHQSGSYHTLKPSTKLSCQNNTHKGSQAPKNSPQNSSHTSKPHSSPLLTAMVSPTLVQPAQAAVPVSVPVPGPSSKWLPAMEEIPENYEEDDFDSVLNHLQGKRSDSRHELVDASELVAEINKLLQDVRQS